MALYSNYLIVEISGIIIAIICAAYFYLKYVTFSYWSSRNIPFVKPIVPFGNFWPVITGKVSIGEFFRDKYLEFRKHPVFGIYAFHKPTLVINDPDLIKLVLTKGFANCQNRGVYCNEKLDPMSAHIGTLPGSEWIHLRAKFSPTFSSSKIKQMFSTIKECSETLVEYVEEKAKESELLEIKDLVARYSTDVIASTAFGIQCDSIRNPDAEFRTWGRKAFKSRPLSNALVFIIPQLADLLGVSYVEKGVTEFFFNAFKDTVEHRSANNIVRKDFLNLIMQLMTKGYIHDDRKGNAEDLSEIDSERITMVQGAAHAFLFWLAGFQTSSSTATHCLYELALHQDIQDKVAREINTVLAKFGGLTYESVNAMPYLHKVVSETLRMYPSIPILNRDCTTAFDLPGTGLHIDVGTSIVIPSFGLHWDPDIFSDPGKFDPERFDEKNIVSRHQYSYLPFGEGPRNCIGMRLGMLQTKVGLLSLLSRYRFTPGPEMQIPLQPSKGNFLIIPASRVTLRFENRSHHGIYTE